VRNQSLKPFVEEDILRQTKVVCIICSDVRKASKHVEKRIRGIGMVEWFEGIRLSKEFFPPPPETVKEQAHGLRDGIRDRNSAKHWKQLTSRLRTRTMMLSVTPWLLRKIRVLDHISVRMVASLVSRSASRTDLLRRS
jgi:hypothetical protein